MRRFGCFFIYKFCFLLFVFCLNKNTNIYFGLTKWPFGALGGQLPVSFCWVVGFWRVFPYFFLVDFCLSIFCIFFFFFGGGQFGVFSCCCLL